MNHTLTAKSAPARPQKNGGIELLCFLFCLIVLLFHEQKYLLGEASLKHGVHLAFFPHGSIGVEFFFVLSGALMASSSPASRPTPQPRRSIWASSPANTVPSSPSTWWRSSSP